MSEISLSNSPYFVGIYARLSVEGDERKNESIENQIELAKAFLKRQRDMILVECYTDLGKTGTHFKREGFERMMQHVRQRKINCIIVKDLSRFGRNHIETGNYIEKIFPFLGVRFIAIADRFDSKHGTNRDEMFGVHLKNLVNELYAKDIAVKVKSAKRAKWELGSYTGGIPPYGYEAEWNDEKKVLRIEKRTAEIVVNIYEQFLAGKSQKEIREWLYQQNIHRPTDYRKTGHIYKEEGEELREWSHGTVHFLLTNPVYTGCLVQGLTCGKKLENRTRHEVKSQDWSVKEHTHEAIISEELFLQVATKIEETSKYSNQKGFSKKIPLEEDRLEGILFCGNCGKKMKRNSVVKEFSSGDRIRRYYYRCRDTYQIDSQQCEQEFISSISLEQLLNLLKTALGWELFFSSLQPDFLLEQSYQEIEEKRNEWRRKQKEIEKQMERIWKEKSISYQNYRMKKISEEEFLSEKKEKDTKLTDLKKQQEMITRYLQGFDLEAEQNNPLLQELLKKKDISLLTKEVIQTFVHRIELYPGKRVKIIFAFRKNRIRKN